MDSGRRERGWESGWRRRWIRDVVGVKRGEKAVEEMETEGVEAAVGERRSYRMEGRVMLRVIGVVRGRW